ncbi:MAG: SRPBCC domain-containing protein [Pseudomonadota bacterium]
MTPPPRLEIRRRLKAAPHAVYAAWTQPEIIARWWGPEGLHLGVSSFDFSEGGHWRTEMCGSEGQSHIVAGIYRELDPPRRLVTTWAWETDGVAGHESLLTVTFEPTGDGTLLTLVHENLPDEATAKSHEGGWTSSLNCLEALWVEAAST